MLRPLSKPKRRSRSHGTPPPFDPFDVQWLEPIKALSNSADIITALEAELTTARQSTLEASIRRGAIVARALELEVVPRGKLSAWIKSNFKQKWSEEQLRRDNKVYIGYPRLKPATDMLEQHMPALAAAGIKVPTSVIGKALKALQLHAEVSKQIDLGASEQAAVEQAIEKLKPKSKKEGSS